MAQSSGSFPYATLAIIAAVISSALLAPPEFSLLRPSQSEKFVHPVDRALDVDARLWEDPFVAARRAETARAARCSQGDPKAKPLECTESLHRRRSMDALVRRLADSSSIADRVLVVLALVPGNPFVGAEESRRRTRFALLSGLYAEGFASDDAEKIGLLEAELPARQMRRADPGTDFRLVAPYELLHHTSTTSERRPAYGRVAVVWVDEAALPQPKLDALALFVSQFERPAPLRRPRLAIIGPSSAQAMRTALEDLNAAVARAPDGLSDPVRRGYGYLAQSLVYNAGATAAPEDLLGLLGSGRMEDHLRDRLASAAGPELAAGRRSRFEYQLTNASDDQVAVPLLHELRARGLGEQPQRLVLLAEAESPQVRSLVGRIEGAAHAVTPGAEGRARPIIVETEQYLRGIDGVTVEGADGATAAAGGKDTKAAGRAAAWPESRDQLDYVRRLVQRLRDSERAGHAGGARPIGAIGILGNDVHDKLLLLQALRSVFPDKVIFTSGLDARLLQPATLGFTRNLIVVSGLPLYLEPGALCWPGDAGDRAPHGAAPPFRDATQTATFLAARLAVVRRADREARRGCIEALTREPAVYEIGRGGLVPLRYAVAADASDGAGDGPPGALAQAPASRASWLTPLLVVAVAAGGTLFVLIFVWPATPAVRAARATIRAAIQSCFSPRELAPANGEEKRLVAFFFLLHSVAFACFVALLAEMVRPGLLSFGRLCVLSVATAVIVGCTLHPLPAWMWALSGRRRTRALAALLAVAAPLVTGAVLATLAAFSAPPFEGFADTCCRGWFAASGVHEPVSWTQGISSWPAQVLHGAALVMALVFLDYAWYGSLHSLGNLQRELGLPDQGNDEKGVLAELRRMAPVPATALGPFDVLWRRYADLSHGAARLVRVVIVVVVTVAAAAWLQDAINAGYQAQAPARGAHHRLIFEATDWLATFGFALLIVVVADATLLACRFIHRLNSRRTEYSEAIRLKFRQALGADGQSPWSRTFAAKPSDRAEGSGSHSLLDDWIDVQVIAGRTASVAQLIFAPFIVLALLLVARSQLFDSWALTPGLLTVFGLYLLTALASAAALTWMAERARRTALSRMAADLRWLQGGSGSAVAKQFEGLIDAVRNNREGAFAPLFEQPALRALLVPLGGAGGAQLLEYFLFVR